MTDHVNTITELMIQREYGADRTAEIAAATKTAMAAIMAEPGTPNGGWARYELRIRIKDAMTARVCQCDPITHLQHAQITCERHYGADVPAIDGMLLCGTCYIKLADERGLPIVSP